ncbi:flagellar assembly protein FliH [Jeotgalibacillus sp. S-D1]|uniref:flagellar assembly protein FliH n=1 Tax=Jeotgalibacillus sp. S-D1 TaxID=2552189 RepID=UPI00105A7BAB|nr:flagellar assembly protein FliH [Jeotgalibacillus sp. S-D1]TDL35044.1 flagellar assembly protein FliH [Jeotgalibacillus sp. S-D1]
MSRIIKSESIGSGNFQTKVIPFQLLTTSENAEGLVRKTVAGMDSSAIIKSAKKNASAILEQAEMDKITIIKEIEDQKLSWENEKIELQKSAYESAFAEGYEDGREKAYADIHLLIEEARQIVSSSKATLENHLMQNEEVILKLSITAAEKILNQKLEEKPDNFLPIIHMGLKEAKEMKDINIHISPSQYLHVKEQEEDLYTIFPSTANVYLYPDEKLEPFQCFIESDKGRIDISVDAQLKELKNQLLILIGDPE